MRTTLMALVGCTLLGPHEALLAAAPKQADMVAYCRSVNLQHASTSVSGIPLEAYFTTFDGLTTVPLYDSFGNSLRVSGELSPDSSQAGLYRTDYILFAGNSVDSYGTAEVRFPVADADANGVPDFLQMNRAGTVDFSGITTRHAPSASTSTLSGRITRGAGSNAGTYTATVRDGTRSLTYTGYSYLLNAVGKFSYVRGTSNSGTFTASVTDEQGATTSYSADANFAVAGPNSLSFPQTLFRGTDGSLLTALPFTLTRTGSRYLGDLEFIDGGARTSWQDYKRWRIEIADTNDANKNGVPDLTDVLVEPPVITQAPQGQTVNAGVTVVITAAASGSAPLQFQWQKNGANIPFATGTTFTLSNVQVADSGRYRVVVSNTAGKVTSAEAVLEVKTPILPPTVATPPLGQTIIEGSPVTFMVVAGGTPPFAYQWRRNGIDLPGATADRWTISKTSSADAGDYTVVINNSAGQVTSPPATLVIQPKLPTSVVPVISLNPNSTNVPVGGRLRLEAAATGAAPLTFQWWQDSQAVAGATNPVLIVEGVSAAVAGNYVLVARNPAGEARSQPAAVVVASAPTGHRLFLARVGQGLELVVQGPRGIRVAVEVTSDLKNWIEWKRVDQTGARIPMTVEGEGVGFRSYRLREVPGAVPQVPTIVTQPKAILAVVGELVQFSVEATGPGPLSFQWKRNGNPIAGATGSKYVIASVRTSSAGSYTVVVTNPNGSIESEVAELVVE
ncbi:MAG: immunoglobulin domain-containing protein [Verrucomicrobiales bacterium]|nr:immunoglobulin domain-containing protein [Verrucomicrobiales bacterium]